MKTTHTPAPWQLTFGENDAAIHNDVTIASINDDALAWQSNARLIAAAPELLSALESLAVWNDGEPCFCHVHGDSERARYTPHDSYCDSARSAIAKAKGVA